MSKGKKALVVGMFILATLIGAAKECGESATGCPKPGQYVNGAGQCVDRAIQYNGGPDDLLGIAGTIEKLQK